jgi:hypothetical protein
MWDASGIISEHSVSVFHCFTLSHTHTHSHSLTESYTGPPVLPFSHELLWIKLEGIYVF